MRTASLSFSWLLCACLGQIASTPVPSDAAIDSGDQTAAADAGGPAVCGHTLCDDFDEPRATIAGAWDEMLPTSGAGLALSNEAHTAPNAMSFLTVPAPPTCVTPCPPEARLVKHFAAHKAVLDAWVYVADFWKVRYGMEVAHLTLERDLVLTLRAGLGGEAFMVEVGNNDGEIDLGIDLVTQSPSAQWAHVRLEADLEVHVFVASYGGATRSLPLPPSISQVIDASIGTYGADPQPLLVDDVWIDLTP